MSKKQKLTSNKQKVTSNEQKVRSNEQRAKSFTSIMDYMCVFVYVRRRVNLCLCVRMCVCVLCFPNLYQDFGLFQFLGCGAVSDEISFSS